MAAKSRITVILVKDVAFSQSISCYFLYGEEKDNVEDKIIYVDDAVPMQENQLKEMPNKHASNEDSNFRNSKFILGFVCNNNCVDREILVEILKQEAKMRSFGILVISINEIFSGKLLVLILHSDHGKTPYCNIQNVLGVEVRLVRLKRNISLSKLSWLHSIDSDRTMRRTENLSDHNLNGITSGHQADMTDETRRNDSHKSSAFIKLLFISISWLLSFMQHGQKIPSVLKQLLSHLPKYLFVAKQLSYRFDQIYSTLVNRQESHDQQDNISSKSISNGNLVISLLIDIILGFLIIYFVFSNQHCLYISSWLIGQKYNIAQQLLSLLKWLMGAPAGLKLNIPLNQFLGNFYIYHVHLWTNYLYFVEAYLPKIILGCTLAGCLGVTFLLALLCDVLLLLTIHIYCFYIYAARLFCLEIHVLASLLRLFTGKKWNFLRSRVDSVEYDVDRLFIGTLLFTIVLFLFPTVFLYYIVFTSLRLLVLLVQSFLYGVVAMLNSFPFFGLWLYFVNPEKLPGQVIVNTETMTCTPGLEDSFVVENVDTIQPHSCLYISFRHKCLPCRNLFRNCAVFETTYRDMFGEGVLKKLLTGQIISKL